MNRVLLEDVSAIVNRIGDRYRELNGKTVLVTGATGFIGSLLIRVFCYLNKVHNARIKIIAVVRDENKAERLFGELLANETVKICTWDGIGDFDCKEDIDYIIHTASPTRSNYFIECPVETLSAIFDGTSRILAFASKKGIKKMVFLSSMEMYGVCNGLEVDESTQGFVDVLDTRSSYPMGKRAAETLCYGYFSEYKVPVVIARLAMCFGGGQPLDDTRVHSSLVKSALSGHDIEVKSSGKTIVNFVYSSDAVVALFLLLLDGVSGDAYNIVGDGGRLTIMDMAKFIAARTNVSVIHKRPDKADGFAPDNTMVLDSSKIRALGWKPEFNLEKSLERLIDYFAEEGY